MSMRSEAAWRSARARMMAKDLELSRTQENAKEQRRLPEQERVWAHDFLPPKRAPSFSIADELTRESTSKSRQEESTASKYGRGFSSPPPVVLHALIPSEAGSPSVTNRSPTVHGVPSEVSSAHGLGSPPRSRSPPVRRTASPTKYPPVFNFQHTQSQFQSHCILFCSDTI